MAVRPHGTVSGSLSPPYRRGPGGSDSERPTNTHPARRRGFSHLPKPIKSTRAAPKLSTLLWLQVSFNCFRETVPSVAVRPHGTVSGSLSPPYRRGPGGSDSERPTNTHPARRRGFSHLPKPIKSTRAAPKLSTLLWLQVSFKHSLVVPRLSLPRRCAGNQKLRLGARPQGPQDEQDLKARRFPYYRNM